MLGRLFLLFTLVTLVEMFILVKLATWMSFSGTLLLVILTGVIGAWLARREGRGVLRRIREQLGRGEMPGEALVDGLCVIIAGAFLMTPGVLTDLVGFMLLLPAARRPLHAAVRTRFRTFMADGRASFVTFDTSGTSSFAGFGGFGGFAQGAPTPPRDVAEAAPPRSLYRDGDVIDVTDD